MGGLAKGILANEARKKSELSFTRQFTISGAIASREGVHICTRRWTSPRLQKRDGSILNSKAESFQVSSRVRLSVLSDGTKWPMPWLCSL